MESQLNQLLTKFAALQWFKVLGIGLLVGLGYYYSFFSDGQLQLDQLAQTQQQVAQTEKEIAAVKEALANADRFEREVKDTVDQFAHIVDFMPTKITTSMLTATISDACTKSGMKLLKIEPKDDKTRVEFYETTKVGFSVEGNFTQLVTFLSALSRVPRMMNFEGFGISVSNDSNDIEVPRLVAAGVLVGFRYIPPTPTADSAAKPNPGAPNAAPAPAPQPEAK